VLRGLAEQFSSGPRDVPAAVDKLRRELDAARDALGQARARLAQRAADEMMETARAAGSPWVIGALDDARAELLRAVAERVTEEPTAVALLAGCDDDGIPVVVARGRDSAFDCGAFLKRAAQAAGGRGGGRPERAEGRMPAGIDWPSLVRSLIDDEATKKGG
jgi:alanyl-tRNA synthetase